MKLHEIQQALEVLGVWKAIKKAQIKTSQIVNTSGVILQRFIEMQDTPASYSGNAGKVVKVNTNETGVEFSSNSGTDWGEIGGILSNQTDLQSALDGKVDKVLGKQLSTEDYTTIEKAKLANIDDDFKRYTFLMS